jgi:hypothetical protein
MHSEVMPVSFFTNGARIANWIEVRPYRESKRDIEPLKSGTELNQDGFIRQPAALLPAPFFPESKTSVSNPRDFRYLDVIWPNKPPPTIRAFML